MNVAAAMAVCHYVFFLFSTNLQCFLNLNSSIFSCLYIFIIPTPTQPHKASAGPPTTIQKRVVASPLVYLNLPYRLTEKFSREGPRANKSHNKSPLFQLFVNAALPSRFFYLSKPPIYHFFSHIHSSFCPTNNFYTNCNKNVFKIIL